MRFYFFWQNNSYGVWEGKHFVLVEAESPEEAFNILMTTGHSNDNSCPCCGDRWNMPSDDFGGVAEFIRYANSIGIDIYDGELEIISHEAKQ